MTEDGKASHPAPANTENDGWRDIAEKASTEKDPEKLVQLVEDLCKKLDQRDANRKRLQRRSA